MPEISTETRMRRLGKAALLAATLIWGSSFVIMKNTLDALPPLALLAVRFSLAAAVLALVFWKKWRLLDRGYIKRGCAMGLCLFLAYTAQTYGLRMTTPSKNAFLTAAYCVLVPFLYWLAGRSRPRARHILAAVLCLAGVGFVSLQGGFSVGAGDLLTLLGSVFYAAHIIVVKLSTEGRDVSLLTVLQFAVVALLSGICSLLVEGGIPAVPAQAVGGLLYLALAATAVALWLQGVGQKYTEPAQASLLLTLEAVFGVLFSMLFYGDRLTPRLVFGFLLIFLAVVCSETGFAFLRRERTPPAEENAQ